MMSNPNYYGESKLISVNSTTSFDDFIAQVAGKWDGITDVNMVLRYSIGDFRNCTLDSEEDLRNLFSICQILSAKLVFVDISRIVEKHLLLIEHQNKTADQYEHIFNHLYDKFRLMPRYDVCPELKKKPLLSDNWCHILDDGVGTTFSEGAIDWFIKAKLQTITIFFVVTKVDLDHSCIGNLVGNKNTRFGAKITGNLVVDNIRADPNCNGKDIQKTLRVSYGLHFPYWKAWRAYESGMHKVFGSYDDSYDHLRWYCNAIERTNEGSIVSLESNPNNNCFERVFIAFKACLDGFKKCRPMLFIDGTFMIGRAKGTLLGATAKDGDNGLLPVAIAIVSAENTSNWAVGGKVAEEWISELPLDKWAVAHSPNIKRYGEMTSNAAEQFNAWIKEARSLPITYMIEHIRRGISQWIVNRRQDSLQWTGALCPRKENLWNFYVTLSRSWMVVDCPSGKFEVMSHPNAVVDLKAKECSCYQWQVRGFPCVHGVAVIRRKCPTVYSIVEEHFFTNTYRACYSLDIHSIPETEKFEFQPTVQNSDKILPPIMNRQPGRPKGKRKPSFGEFPRKKAPKACARCGNISNHDPTTCLIPTEEAWLF
ncbi:hypothetical protein OROMI_017393 [Orobanche minor]